MSTRSRRQCWESYIGQQIYKVMVVVFIFELLLSIITDPIKAFLYNHTNWYKKVCALW